MDVLGADPADHAARELDRDARGRLRRRRGGGDAVGGDAGRSLGGEVQAAFGRGDSRDGLDGRRAGGEAVA